MPNERAAEMSTTSQEPVPQPGVGAKTATGPRPRRRINPRIAAGVVGLAAVGAAAGWAIARGVLGQPLAVAFGDQPAQQVGLVASVIASLVAGGLGLALLALLNKVTARATTIWTIVAAVVLALSLSGPLTAQADAGTKTALALLHVVVGAVLIVGLPRSVGR